MGDDQQEAEGQQEGGNPVSYCPYCADPARYGLKEAEMCVLGEDSTLKLPDGQKYIWYNSEDQSRVGDLYMGHKEVAPIRDYPNYNIRCCAEE
jgi:hypothetical protein